MDAPNCYEEDNGLPNQDRGALDGIMKNYRDESLSEGERLAWSSYIE